MTPTELLREIASNAGELVGQIADLTAELRRMTRERNQEQLRNVDCTPIPETDAFRVQPTGPVAGARKSAVKVALNQWRQNIAEPPGRSWEEIDKYISHPLGLGWGWVEEYEKNGQFAWCGAFAAYCFGSAGLSYDIRHKHMASCYRLRKWAKKHDRLLAPDEIERGDIAVVGRADAPSYGNHITICESAIGTGLTTIEGNASGRGPTGMHEGVITRQRPFAEHAKDDREYRVMYGVRFEAEDFNTEAVEG